MGFDVDGEPDGVVLPIGAPLIPSNLASAALTKESCTAEVPSSCDRDKCQIPDQSWAKNLVLLANDMDYSRGKGLGDIGPSDPDPLQQRGMVVDVGPDAYQLFDKFSVRDQRPNPVSEISDIVNDSMRNHGIDGRGGHHVSWANVMQGKKLVRTSKLHLSIVPPSIINGEKVTVCPIKEEEENLKHWENTLVSYVLGKRPYYIYLKQTLEKQ